MFQEGVFHIYYKMYNIQSVQLANLGDKIVQHGEKKDRTNIFNNAQTQENVS